MPNIYHILLWHLFVTVNLLFSSWSFCHGKTDCLIFQGKSLPVSRPVYRNRKVLEHITHFLVSRLFDVLFIERERSASKFQKLVAPKIAFNSYQWIV